MFDYKAFQGTLSLSKKGRWEKNGAGALPPVLPALLFLWDLQHHREESRFSHVLILHLLLAHLIISSILTQKKVFLSARINFRLGQGSAWTPAKSAHWCSRRNVSTVHQLTIKAKWAGTQRESGKWHFLPAYKSSRQVPRQQVFSKEQESGEAVKAGNVPNLTHGKEGPFPVFSLSQYERFSDSC